MANYVFTHYAVVADKELLTKVADAINAADGYFTSVYNSLGLMLNEEQEEDGYLCRTEWEQGAKVEERDGKAILFFTQAFPYSNIDLISGVLISLGQKEEEMEVYWQASCFESGWHGTNDVEKKFFPERYIWIKIQDGVVDEYKLVNTLDDAIALIKKEHPEFPTSFSELDDLLKYIKENELEYDVYNIEEE